MSEAKVWEAKIIHPGATKEYVNCPAWLPGKKRYCSKGAGKPRREKFWTIVDQLSKLSHQDALASAQLEQAADSVLCHHHDEDPFRIDVLKRWKKAIQDEETAEEIAKKTAKAEQARGKKPQNPLPTPPSSPERGKTPFQPVQAAESPNFNYRYPTPELGEEVPLRIHRPIKPARPINTQSQAKPQSFRFGELARPSSSYRLPFLGCKGVPRLGNQTSVVGIDLKPGSDLATVGQVKSENDDGGRLESSYYAYDKKWKVLEANGMNKNEPIEHQIPWAIASGNHADVDKSQVRSFFYAATNGFQRPAMVEKEYNRWKPENVKNIFGSGIYKGIYRKALKDIFEIVNSEHDCKGTLESPNSGTCTEKVRDKRHC